MGRPQRGCSTLGREDFMRVPSPAANTTAVTGFFFITTHIIYYGTVKLQPNRQGPGSRIIVK